jgi:ABC-type sugar transport system permease subunit
VVWFTPVLISYVVVGIIWVWIYDYDWGVLNTVLRGIGLGSLAYSWLGDPSTALWAVLVTQVWKWVGFNMIVFLAALFALPRDVLDAAELDHCGWMAKLVYVILPMLRPTMASLLVLSFIGKMMVFDVVWIMTHGGPLWSTETVSTYVYKRAFDWNTFDLGYPSAIAVVWFILILGFVALMTRLLRQRGKLEL